MLLADYFYKKRKQIKKQNNMKNSLQKLAQMYKQKNHQYISSKNILHMDNIIEEYINLDIINEEILFQENDFEKNLKQERQQ